MSFSVTLQAVGGSEHRALEIMKECYYKVVHALPNAKKLEDAKLVGCEHRDEMYSEGAQDLQEKHGLKVALGMSKKRRKVG